MQKVLNSMRNDDIRATGSSTIPPCMEATITHNTGLVVLLNRGGVTHNAGPVAMHNAVFGPEFGPCVAIRSEITIYNML